MNGKRVSHRRLSGGIVAACACVLLVFSAPAEAQLGGGGGRGRKTGPSKPRPAQPPPPPEKGVGDVPGTLEGWILRFKPAKDDQESEDLLGVLLVKPTQKKARVVKLNVPRTDTLKIEVGTHKFNLDEDVDLIWKGLYCRAGWGFKDPDAKRKVRELRVLSFDTLDIAGKIVKIEDDMIVIKARPKNGQDWPDAKAKTGRTSPRNPKARNKKARIRWKKLKLKVMEDVSQFYDVEKEEIDLNDFEVNQEVEATVVYSKREGMVVAMRMPSEGGSDNRGRGGRPGPGTPRGGPGARGG
ncbi:MAG: hypothetical protein ACE5E1_03320 [Phycisphaerae bacterium]